MPKRSRVKPDGIPLEISEIRNEASPSSLEFTPHEDVIVEAAFTDFLAGLGVPEIAEKHGVGRSTIYDWIKRFGWKKDRTSLARRRFERAKEKYLKDVEEREDRDRSGVRVEEETGREFIEMRVLRCGEPWRGPFGLVPIRKREPPAVREMVDPESGGLVLRIYF
jgi:hypothetical protein